MSSSITEIELLRRHTRLLFQSRDRIRADLWLAGAYSPEMRLMMAYTTGGGLLPLAVLVDLWDQGDWTAPCERCSGQVLIHRMGGSPLSGSRRWRGVCVECGALADSTWSPPRKSFVDLSIIPVSRLRKKWNAPEDFALEQVMEQNPRVRPIDIQGGMTLESDEGSVDLQLGFGSWEELGNSPHKRGVLMPTLTLEAAIRRLQS